MNLKETLVKSELKYSGKILKLCVDEVTLPDGKRSVREIIRHTDGAAVLFIKEGKVALVRQYRYAYAKETLEIPAGKLDEGEDAALGAARELEEETGYRATSLKKLVSIYASPGYTDETIHVYLAESAEFVGEKPDEDEFVSCKFYTLDEVIKMLEEGRICDAKTVVAIYKYIATHK